MIPKNLIHIFVRNGAPIVKGDCWEDEEDYDIIDYYSGDCFNTSAEFAEVVLNDLKKNGINYKKSTHYKDGTEKGFAGTFVDPILNEFLYMDIVSNSGETYRFAMRTRKTAIELTIELLKEIPLNEAISFAKNKIRKGAYYQYEEFSI